MTNKTSAAGVTAIRQREGCVLHAYRDSVGVITIGVGHTGRASPPTPLMGDSITAAQADDYLAGDLAPFEAAVNTALKRPPTQNQFDACVSLAFNIGAGGFTGSTVVHKFNGGDLAGAADAFLMWEKPTLLKTRRIGERAQFLSAAQPVVTVVRPATSPVPAPLVVGPRIDVVRPSIAGAASTGLRAWIISLLKKAAA